ncbi:uncharacterized protein CTRU02_205101 [Colletotrichum truncatum]|uniref:Uncharacterized protein n=1 Tax=Colletotrichum truncatum TaxID=5467 RepID=A0ACC3Z334_COLTU|nr:uncharacterized protein CTRU02_06068 [Colletotrichum truncatum]KAF6793196.1 hypothetical protein CTRU02_06068 [Colletotrichum truncatum]
MSSNQSQDQGAQYTYVPRQHQGQAPTQFTYQQAGGSAMLNYWFSESEASAPYHNIAAYRPSPTSGSGADARGTAPSSTGATRGSGQGRRK